MTRPRSESIELTMEVVYNSEGMVAGRAPSHTFEPALWPECAICVSSPNSEFTKRFFFSEKFLLNRGIGVDRNPIMDEAALWNTAIADNTLSHESVQLPHVYDFRGTVLLPFDAGLSVGTAMRLDPDKNMDWLNNRLGTLLKGNQARRDKLGTVMRNVTKAEAREMAPELLHLYTDRANDLDLIEVMFAAIEVAGRIARQQRQQQQREQQQQQQQQQQQPTPLLPSPLLSELLVGGPRPYLPLPEQEPEQRPWAAVAAAATPTARKRSRNTHKEKGKEGARRRRHRHRSPPRSSPPSTPPMEPRPPSARTNPLPPLNLEHYHQHQHHHPQSRQPSSSPPTTPRRHYQGAMMSPPPLDTLLPQPPEEQEQQEQPWAAAATPTGSCGWSKDEGREGVRRRNGRRSPPRSSPPATPLMEPRSASVRMTRLSPALQLPLPLPLQQQQQPSSSPPTPLRARNRRAMMPRDGRMPMAAQQQPRYTPREVADSPNAWLRSPSDFRLEPPMDT